MLRSQYLPGRQYRYQSGALKPCRTRSIRLLQQVQSRRMSVWTRSNVCEVCEGELVDNVLQRIKDTDRGANMSTEGRAKVDALLGQLEDIGRNQQPRPLDNDLLFHHFSVDYVSRGPRQTGEPAGGRFRRGLGKFLFTTQGLYQSVIRPDIATNKVEFKLLGLIPGYVGLRGRVVPVDQATVRVFFEPPVLSLSNWFTVRIGPPSQVQLTTTYLDERVRLGRGSFGSLFVFRRGEEADNAGMDQVGVEPNLIQVTTPGLVAAYLAVLGACAAAFFTQQPILQGMAALTALLASGIASVLYRGGNEDQQEVKPGQNAASAAGGNEEKSAASSPGTAAGVAVSSEVSKDGTNGSLNTAQPVQVPAAA